MLSTITFAQTAELLWDPDGVPIRQGHNIEWSNASCVGSLGEVITAWSDTRNQWRDIFVQKIDDQGNELWTEDGVLVYDGNFHQRGPVLESDRNGGAFISWVDFRSDSAGDIYSQHIGPDGELLFDADGVPICTAGNHQNTISSCYDEAGGFFITWQDERNGSCDLYITRLLADGSIAPGFEADGLPVVTEPGEQISVSLVSDLEGGAWITWADKRVQDNHNIYIQHLLADGTMVLDENGFLVCGTEGIQKEPRLAPDALGGVFVSWVDKRNDNFGDIYLQHLNSEGTISFTADGIPVSANPDIEEKNNRIVNAGVGMAIIVWQDNRNDPDNTVGDIYIQKVSTSDLIWTPGGIPACTAPEEQVHARMTSDNNGGAFIAWTDYRNGGAFGYEDIYLQHVDSDGNMLWGDDGNGLPASVETDSQYSPSVRADQNGGVFVSWSDLRYGSQGIFSNCLDSDGESRYDEEQGREVIWGIGGNVSRLTSTATSDNGVIFVWEDRRAHRSEIVAQKMTDQLFDDGMGEMLWEHNGVALHPDFSERDQREPQIIPDGEGAYIGLLWGPDLASAAFLTRLGSDGVPLWEEPVCVTAEYNVNPTDYQQDLHICDDDAGGVIAIWTDHNELVDPMYTRIFAQRFNPAGERLWGEDGVQVSTNSDNTWHMLQAVDADNQGGVYILWMYGVWGDFNLRMQHIDTDGNVVEGWDAEGLDVCTASANQWQGTLVTLENGDDSPGVLAVWNDPRESANSKDIFGQSVLADGTLQWEEDGILLVTGTSDQEFSRVRPDGESGFYLLWKDFSNLSDYNLYMQHFDDSGTPLWTIDSTAVCEAVNDQWGADFILFERDGENRMICNWADLRTNTHYDMYGQEISADGAHSWDGEDGAVINDRFHHQKYPTISYDGEYGAYIGWIDYRSSFAGSYYRADDPGRRCDGYEEFTNIFVQRVNSYHIHNVRAAMKSHPNGIYLAQSYPNPFNPHTTIEYELARPGMIMLSVYNIRGQLVDVIHEGFMQAGQHTVTWAPADLSSGVYIYQLSAGTDAVSKKMVLVR